MRLKKAITLLTIITTLTILVSFENVYADEIIEVEVKYTNGDRVDFNAIKFMVYQDFDDVPILEKNVESNPDFITVPENHRYKIEVYANGMYADVGYVQLDESSKKLDITIPLSGGLQLEIFYKNGEEPIEDATVVLKSQDNSEWARGITNDQGETIRFWIQSTTKQEDHYIVDVYFDDIFLTSYFPIKIQAGIAVNQKITTTIPEIVEDLISINLYAGSQKITSVNGDYKITLIDSQGNEVSTSNVNFRGDAQFSNLKSGTYTAKITTNSKTEDNLWPQTNLNIIGDLNKFNIIKKSESIIEQENPLLSCNCISFRLDDIQDYWLADAQIELINLFAEKNIPLTVGVIGSLIGSDERIVSILKDNLEKDNIEIANHSWNNDVLPSVDENVQEQYITETNERILELFDVTPTSFIPPENKYDENTVNVLQRNGFTHLIAHIDENTETNIKNDSFYTIPAITETGILLDDIQWQIQEKGYIKEKIIQSVEQKGYVIIMMHPQEFSLNAQGDYDVPNQEYLSELSLLLDEITQLDAKIVKISEVMPFDESSEEVPKIQDDIPEIQDDIPEIQDDIPEIDSCNCIAFRLNDVQDYWLNDVQIKIMETFIENDTPLTIGIIANAFGNDQKITEFVNQNKENHMEIATRGMGLTSFTNYEKEEQNDNLKESLDLIEFSINERAKVFIPPGNKFNADTLEILEKNNITHISSSLVNGDSPPFQFKNEKVYRFPQITSTGEYNPSKNIFERISNQQIISEVIQSISDYGFSVISINYQEFSILKNSTYVNSVNEEQINELKNLINELNEKGYKIVPVGKINSNLIIIVPEWIKNNAGWWADGTIDDKAFVDGIEYLVQENIINVSGESQEVSNEEKIPLWLKSNAGWWASGEIDNKAFVDGIEYLVKNGIIIH